MIRGPASTLLRSFTFRLVMAYVGLFAASIALLFGVVYWIGVARPLALIEDQVSSEASVLAQVYIVDGAPALIRQLEARSLRPSQNRAFHVFIAYNGDVASSNLPTWPKRFATGWRRIEADLYSDGEEDDHEALIQDRLFADGARLLVGRDVEFVDEREEFLAEAARWIAAITVVLGIAGGVLMSLAVGRRIDSVTQTARRVIAGDLGERVPVHGTGDDFDQLAETLNLMLSRIEELLESVRRVSDSVAHELRTPLARLHADLEELSYASEGQNAFQPLIRQAIREALRLQSVFDALLRIARIESGRHAAGIKPIDLTALLRDATEFHAPDMEAKGLRLETNIAEGLTIEADSDLLFQAVSNLLDNANKHTLPDGSVELAGRRHSDGVLISVTDTGPGIPTEHRDRVTERFYRVPGTEKSDGAGLGLSMVAAVARLHHGTLTFADAGPGVCVEMIIPASWECADASL